MVEVVEFFRTYWKRVGAVVISVAVALLLVEMIRPHERTISVSGLTWSRTVDIERWTTVEERTWYRLSIPSSGRFTHRRYEFHYTDRVLVGYTAESDVGGVPIYTYIDVYDYRYYYDIEEWKHARDVTTHGTWETEPYWGEVVLSGPTGDYDVGKERESGRSEEYRVTDADGKVYTASRDLWDSLRIGDKRILIVHFDGRLTDERR